MIVCQQVGDGTNLVVLFAGALLEKSRRIDSNGSQNQLKSSTATEMATYKVLDEILPELTVDEVKDVKNLSEVSKAIRSSVMSKQYGNEDFLTE